jgi:hypothetical protein
MKIISFSLWGTNPVYLNGALENIKLQEKIYPGWTCRFYVDKNNPIVGKLKKFPCQVVLKDPENYLGLFWRFEPAWDDTIKRFIVRDCDSRLNIREADAVREWEDSPYSVHSMKDHFHHRNYFLLGGMWGATKGFCTDFKRLRENFIFEAQKQKMYLKKELYFDTDQYFLNRIIWPKVQENCLTHDDLENFSNQKTYFKKKLPPGEFVGQQWGSDNQPLKAPI